MKGNPPKPDAVKVLQGNAGKRAKENSPDENLSREIFFSDEPGWAPPDWLPEGAKAIWREQLPIVRLQTKIQMVGLPVFANYCHAQYRVQKYTGALQDGETYTTPSGFQRLRPEVELREKAANAVRNLADSLNLTPKSWINSMGTFAGRQLDMFMNGGRAPDTAQAPGEAGKMKGDDLSAFLGGKPTMQ